MNNTHINSNQALYEKTARREGKLIVTNRQASTCARIQFRGAWKSAEGYVFTLKLGLAPLTRPRKPLLQHLSLNGWAGWAHITI